VAPLEFTWSTSAELLQEVAEQFIHAIFPFQKKKTHVNPNFVVFKPANREFGLMQTTPVYHIRMPSWPPKRHTADNMSKPKKNVFDFGNAFAVALVLCEFFFVSTVLRRRNQGTSSACLLAYWVG